MKINISLIQGYNLIDRLQPLQRLKTDFGLELRAVNLAFLLTHKLLLIISGNSLNHCLKYGVHYSFGIGGKTKKLCRFLGNLDDR